MPTVLDQLISSIEQALGPALALSLTNASAGADLYEAYVFSLILDAAAIEGASITFKDVNGDDPATFIFRTSPGHIYSKAQLYSHAVLEFSDVPPLEAHTGVYVSGKSGLIHEADVLVLLAEEANTCRDNDVPPRSHQALLAVECKFYSAGLQLGLARADIPCRTAREKYIHKILCGLQAEGFEQLEKLEVPSWNIILAPGERLGLYLVLSGNASIAFPKRSMDPHLFTRNLIDLAAERNPVGGLNESADCHPIVLCKGDLIGEFEYVQRREPMGHVIAATFFKTPETRKRLQTTLVRLPGNSKVAAAASFHVMTEKLALMNHLLMPTIHKRQSRINNILALCFAGLFPVYRVFYRAPDGGCLVEVPDSCGVYGEGDRGRRYACLGHLDPRRDPLGIELSTSYLSRCFGFPDGDAIIKDVNGRAIDVYSDAARCKHKDTEQNGIAHLGAESLLFFLHNRNPQHTGFARDFVAGYGMDMDEEFLERAHRASAHF